jgi:hypothetical protein
MPKKKKHRLAKGSDGVERKWEPSELFQLYSRGWLDGANGAVMRPDHLDVPEYSDGYVQGYRARGNALYKACKRLKYKPEVLRLAKKEKT